MKCKEVVNRIIYDVLLSRLPSSNQFFGGRAWKKLRAFAVKNFIEYMGKNVNIQRKATISSKLSIGNNSGVGIGARIGGRTYIGNNVNMGMDCVIITQNHAHSRTDIPMQQQGYEEEKPVYIGNDVWIGDRVMIMPGAYIGDGVIVAAGAVAAGKLPDYTIVGGVPARVIRNRKEANNDYKD